jgi:hypothetical protein
VRRCVSCSAAFASGAPDLVAGDTNGVADVFVRDPQPIAVWPLPEDETDELGAQPGSATKAARKRLRKLNGMDLLGVVARAEEIAA